MVDRCRQVLQLTILRLSLDLLRTTCVHQLCPFSENIAQNIVLPSCWTLTAVVWRTHCTAWWKEIPEPDGRWRLLFGGCRWRQHPRDDSLFPQFADGDPLTGLANPSTAGTPAPRRPPHPRLEAEGFAPSVGHQHRIDELFALTFPALAAAGVEFQYRWGGLQCFTADDRPLVGAVEPGSHVFTIAGLSGRGNSYSDVATEYLAGIFANQSSPITQEFGDLFTKYLAINRESAKWRTSGMEGKKSTGTIKLPNNPEQTGTAIGLDYWGTDAW